MNIIREKDADHRADDQRAADQHAADQRADDHCANYQRADDQRATEQRGDDQRTIITNSRRVPASAVALSSPESRAVQQLPQPAALLTRNPLPALATERDVPTTNPASSFHSSFSGRMFQPRQPMMSGGSWSLRPWPWTIMRKRTLKGTSWTRRRQIQSKSMARMPQAALSRHYILHDGASYVTV